MARASTILVLLRDGVWRADLRGGSVVALVRHATPPNTTLRDRIGQASGDASLARNTYVLSDEAFAQTIELDLRASRSLEDDSLRAALALEAQIHSGLAASEAAISFRTLSPTKSARRFLVQEISRFDLDEIQATVAERGGRLAGIAHPAGVPRLGLAGSDGRMSARIERWSDVFATVSRVTDGACDVDLSRSERVLRRGPESQPFAGEWLLVPGAPRGEVPTDAIVADLADDDVARRWIEAWGDALARREVPLLEKPKEPLSTRQRAAIGIAFACVVAVGCWFDRDRLATTRAETLATLTRVRQPIDSLTQTRSELVKLESELREIEATRTRTPELARFDWNGALPGHFCAALAKHRPTGVMIDSIEIGIDGGRISGVSARLDGIEDLLTSLRVDADSMAIALTVHSRRRVESGKHAGLYSFEIDAESRGRPIESKVEQKVER